MNRWPHQLRGVADVQAAFARGVRRACLSCPTGGGKSVMIRDVAQGFIAGGRHVALYTNRKMLLDQLSDGLMDAGIYHGVRAAGFEDERDHPFQVCSIQTEASRVLKRKQWELHACRPGDLAVIDEGHLHTGPTAQAIRRMHVEAGAFTLDVTATPLGMAEVCDELIQAGTMPELRECGALVEARHFGCDEPDMRRVKGVKEGEDLTEKQARQAIMRPGLFGRIWDNFERINPRHLPTVCFGPDVEGSLWIAQQFVKKGVPAAHIDGDDVWLNGELRSSDREAREHLRSASRSGEVVVVCNRFVMREGIDYPWLRHAIFATVFGAVGTCVQSGGRLLRADHDPDTVARFGPKEFATVQDHGGNFWRHGSLNADRVWSLGDTAASVAGKRADRLRAKKEREPFLCPQCGRVWVAGRTCNPARGGCGHVLDRTKKARPVVTEEGELREVKGDVFRPRRIIQRPDGPAIWERMFWRSRTAKGRRTFRAAEALFARENNWQWPDRSWPFMPTNEDDFFREVPDVPMDRLIPKPELARQP